MRAFMRPLPNFAQGRRALPAICPPSHALPASCAPAFNHGMEVHRTL